MISSVFASFAPLLLLALSVTAAPSTTPGTMDLSPITTPKTVLFIDHKMNFTGTTTVYDDTAAAAYTVEPSNGKFLVLKSVKSPSDVKFIQSSPSNCMSILSGSLYLDQDNGKDQWTLKDATHTPSAFDPTYVPGSKGKPTGEIHVGPDNKGVIATIEDNPSPPKSLPKASYYSISTPANKGHDPYVTPTDALVLVVTILQAQAQCSTGHKTY